MKIKIVSIEKPTGTAKNGKTYEMVEVAYKNLTFQGKMESRKIMPFGATADTAKMLAKASPGEFYEITVVKNAAGFNEWTSCVLAPATEEPPPVPETSAPTPSAKSTYQTAEERAKTQVYIVRQSSINQALTFLELNKGKPTVQDVLAVAKQFEQHVFAIAQPKSLLDMENDLPPVEAYDDDIPH